MASFGAARVHLTLDVRDETHSQSILDFLKETYPEQVDTITIDK